MLHLQLGIFALMLEAPSWVSALLGSNDDGALLLFLLAHSITSVLVSAIAINLLPKHLAKPRLPVLILIFGTSYAIPVIGILIIIGGIFLLHALPQIHRADAFEAIELPEIDVHQRPGVGFRQAGMRSFLSNTKAPVATRLRALIALQNVSGRVASPLLRDVLSDSSEDIRLLAYGILDNKEKHINNAIHTEAQNFSQASEGSPEQAETARRLADLYWELVYQELVLGDLRLHALQQSLHFTRISLAGSPDDAGLHLRLGRLLQPLGETHLAHAAYNQALALGLPKTRILPYLAEVAFDLGDFRTVHRLMHELGDWQSLPRLQPVIRYWNEA